MALLLRRLSYVALAALGLVAYSRLGDTVDMTHLPTTVSNLPPAVLPPDWAGLSPAERQILAPLANDWNHFEAKRRLKWLGIAKRYPSMSTAEQERVQIRMKEWAKLSPEMRMKAREQYKKIKLGQNQPEQIREKWEAYESLPDEEKTRLRETYRPKNTKPLTGNRPPLSGTKPTNIPAPAIMPSKAPATSTTTPTSAAGSAVQTNPAANPASNPETPATAPTATSQ